VLPLAGAATPARRRHREVVDHAIGNDAAVRLVTGLAELAHPRPLDIPNRLHPLGALRATARVQDPQGEGGLAGDQAAADGKKTKLENHKFMKKCDL
jgi:hypothetical protein